MKLLTEKEQLALFGQPDAAEKFMELASLSMAIWKAHMRNTQRPTEMTKMTDARKEFEELWKKTYAPQNDKEASVTLSLEEGRTIYNRGGYFWPEVMMKFFEFFPKDVVKKILKDYSKAPFCRIPYKIQMKMLKFFTKDEIKDISLNNHIHFCSKAQMFIYKNYNYADGMQILAHNLYIDKDIVEKILARPDAKEYLSKFLELGGSLSNWMDDLVDGVSQPQMMIVKHFNEEDATEILSKILVPGEKGSKLCEHIMNHIIDNFSSENAKKLLLAHIDVDGHISMEILSKVIKNLPEEDAKEVIQKYLNSSEYLNSDDDDSYVSEKNIQRTVIIYFSSFDNVKKILECFGKYLNDEILLLIMTKFSPVEAKDLIKSNMECGDVSDEVILTIMDTFSEEDAKELLKWYQENGGKLCKEARHFLSRS